MDVASCSPSCARCPRRPAPKPSSPTSCSDRWAPRCAEVRRDPIGNVIARVGGTRPAGAACRRTWTRSATSSATSPTSGFLLLDTAQGDRRTGPERRHPVGQPVRVLTRDGDVDRGPDRRRQRPRAHRRAARGRARLRRLLGRARARLARRGRSPRACTSARPSIFSAPMRAIGELLVGPAMDNRVGLAVMDALIERRRASSPASCGSARPSRRRTACTARARSPLAERFDAAIALDVGLVGDIPGGRRARVRDQPRRRPDRRPPRHRDHLRPHADPAPAARSAATHDIPAQDGLFAGYGSDGLALAETGSPTALLTVATRYTHTAFETIHPRRPERAVDLLRALVTTRTAGTPVSSETDKRAAAVYAADWSRTACASAWARHDGRAAAAALAARGLALRCVVDLARDRGRRARARPGRRAVRRVRRPRHRDRRRRPDRPRAVAGQGRRAGAHAREDRRRRGRALRGDRVGREGRRAHPRAGAGGAARLRGARATLRRLGRALRVRAR